MFSRRRHPKRNDGKKIYNKQNIIGFSVLLLAIFVLFSLSNYVFQITHVRNVFEKDVTSIAERNAKDVFYLDKILLFSSASATNNETIRPIWDLNVFQYTDIAISIGNHAEEGYTSENTIQSLTIENISIHDVSTGSLNMYYKDVTLFGKPSYSEGNLVEKNLTYTIIEPTATIDYTKPQLYSTGSTPIVLEYVNIVKNHVVIPDISQAITYDGTLLKRSGISTVSIKGNISFTIHIINNLNQEFLCTVNIPIPLEDDNTSIINGSFKKEITGLSNYKFYQKN